MAGITLQQAQDQLDTALTDLAAARKLKESQMTGPTGGRKLMRQDLTQLQANVQFWDTKVKMLSRNGGLGGLVTFRGVPIE